MVRKLNKAPTIHDLAADLRISSTTVWRALHGHARVSPETKERVLDRANAINYIPSFVAQNLSHGHTRTLGFIVPTIAHPVFSALIQVVEEFAFDRGYAVIVCNARLDIEIEAEYARMLRRRRVEGVLVVPFSKQSHEWDNHLIELQKNDVPVVLLEQELPSDRFDKVVADNFRASHAMTQHLIKLGHKRIAFASHAFYERDMVGRERLAGFEKAMAGAGLSGKSQVLLDVCEFGKKEVLRYHREKIVECFGRPDRPTALFAAMDMLAILAMKTLREIGLEIPRDVVVAGFDNIDDSALTNPPLTTVMQPAAEMSRLAIEILFDRIDGKAARRKKVLCKRLPCQLVIRESCGSGLRRPRPGVGMA